MDEVNYMVINPMQIKLIFNTTNIDENKKKLLVEKFNKKLSDIKEKALLLKNIKKSLYNKSYLLDI